MIPPDHALLALDTNVLIHTIRDNAIGRRIGTALRLGERSERPLISIVTVGETLALARRLGWGTQKTSTLRDLLTNLVVVDVSHAGVVDRYAELTAWCQSNGRSLDDNDRWIAATASVADAWLITTDRDFDPLDPKFLRHVYFDPGR
ncbi:MAG: type II toxin-antitoxin system VapC family toxin [Gemmatimonadales bacterium]